MKKNSFSENEIRDEIEQKVFALMESRGIDTEEASKNFEINLFTNLSKYAKAKRNNDEYAMIKALCYTIIVTIEAGKSFFGDYVDMKSYLLRVGGGCAYELVTLISSYGYDPYKCLFEVIAELESKAGRWDEECGAFYPYLGAYTREEAEEKAMGLVDEKIISEDEEYWYLSGDKRVKKIKKWYAPNFEACKAREGE